MNLGFFSSFRFITKFHPRYLLQSSSSPLGCLLRSSPSVVAVAVAVAQLLYLMHRRLHRVLLLQRAELGLSSGWCCSVDRRALDSSSGLSFLQGLGKEANLVLTPQ